MIIERDHKVLFFMSREIINLKNIEICMVFFFIVI